MCRLCQTALFFPIGDRAAAAATTATADDQLGSFKTALLLNLQCNFW